MDAQPAERSDPKEHLFAVGVGRKKSLSDHSFASLVDRDTPEDPFFGMQIDLKNFPFESKIPLFAEEFDLSEFGHEVRVAWIGRGTSGRWKGLSAIDLATESGLGRRPPWAIF